MALAVLPARYRTHLRRLYDVARVIDDLGDEAKTDRSAALLAFRAELDRIWHGGTARSPVRHELAGPELAGHERVVRELADSVVTCALPEQPFLDLIEANLRDQTTSVYATYDELLGYCELSANPVGRLVLAVFGSSSPERAALSDQVCTALQIIEHCQDVAEDHRAGRIYLPLADLDRFGVRRADLDAAVACPAVRELVRFEVERAQAMLVRGSALVGQLSGWARLAVAGYVAGGLAAATAMRRAEWSVLPSHPRSRRRDVLAGLLRLWLGVPARHLTESS